MHTLDAERIREAAACEGLRVDTVERIASTNAALIEAPFADSPAAPRLLAAALQSAGRGRRGRRWLGRPGRSAAFSIAIERLVRFEPPPAALSLAVGVACAGALARWAPDVQLKWPNDLLRARRKFGGILVECRRGTACPGAAPASIERIVVGIGLNLLAPADEDAIGQSACGLFDHETLSAHAAESVIAAVAAAVLPAMARFLAEGLAPFADDWRRLDALQGEMVTLHDGSGALRHGRALGLDPGGGLRVQTAEGVRVLNSGEVSVRRSDALI